MGQAAPYVLCLISSPQPPDEESLSILNFPMGTAEAQRFRNLLEGNSSRQRSLVSSSGSVRRLQWASTWHPGSSHPSDTGWPLAPTPSLWGAPSWRALALPPSLSKPDSSFKSRVWDAHRPLRAFRFLLLEASPWYAPSLPDTTVLPLHLFGSLSQANTRCLLSGNIPLENESHEVLHKINSCFKLILFLLNWYRL